jgi:hypothetical protein
MIGLEIFFHAIGQVFGNFGKALKISALLFLLQFVAVLLLGFYKLNDPHGFFMLLRGDVPWLRLLLLGVICAFLNYWIAVGWHRFILRKEEPQDIVPAYHGDRILEYFGWVLLILVITVIAGLIFGLVMGFVLGKLLFVTGAIQNMFVANIIIALVISAPLTAFSLRLSIVLPGAALGDGRDISHAWDSARGAFGSLYVLAIAMLLSIFLLDVLQSWLWQRGGWPVIFPIIFLWIKLMVGLSILTTLYGHYVEKRPLV